MKIVRRESIAQDLCRESPTA